MTKFNNTDIRNGLMVNLEDIYIFPVSDTVYAYLEKIWSSFVNKMVALTFPNDENIFDHAVFEVIQGSDTKIVASSTHFKMKELIGNKLNKDIQEFISKSTLPANFKDFTSFSFILPDEFGAISPMLEIKRNELFGSYVSLRAFSFGEARHAKFVNNSDKELVISFGENKYFGLKKNRWEIKIPRNAGNSFIMALSYYLIGKIQESKTPYFKKNLANFCQEGPLVYGSKKPFDIIVPGN